MSVARACAPCRDAKAKCDAIRPICGRCALRCITCSGYTPDEGGFFFRDQNETARKGSERARRPQPRPMQTTWSLSPLTPPLPLLQKEINLDDEELRQEFPWLNQSAVAELSQPLKRSVETRAIERLFIDWTLDPCNHGASPGHMYDLPRLYDQTSETSILRLAVQALAYADIKDYPTPEGPLRLKARQSYGSALYRLRSAATDDVTLAQDHVLSALLILDDLEIMHLDRNEPLGPHAGAIRLVLRARGDEQFTNRSKFALWRVAHHRLLARQLLLGEDPDPIQYSWLSKLNTNLPDLHITSDVLHITHLTAKAKRLTQGEVGTAQSSLERIAAARDLAKNIHEYVEYTGHWPHTLSKLWKPEHIDPHEMSNPVDFGDSLDLPMDHLLCPEVLSFHDIWVAGVWNFHASAQIIMRESLISLTRFIAEQQRRVLGQEDLERIAQQRNAVHKLGADIIDSMPPLLGYTHADDARPYSFPHGKMLGRFFSFFPLWVIQRSDFAFSTHKQCAFKVTQWIRMHYSLG